MKPNNSPEESSLHLNIFSSWVGFAFGHPWNFCWIIKSVAKFCFLCPLTLTHFNVQFYFQVSGFCREALAITNSIIHPRSFPQVSSAPGPSLLGTSEHLPSNGPLPVAHDQSLLGSYSANEDPSSHQRLLRTGAFENGNSSGYSQIEQSTMGYGEWQQTTADNNAVVTSLSSSVGKKSTEGSEPDTSVKHTEQVDATGSESKAIQNEKPHREGENLIAANTDSQMSEIQLTASSSNTSKAQVLNQEGFITANTRKSSLSNSNRGTLVGEDTTSFHQPGKEYDSVDTLGTSDPKRRRIDNNSNVSDEQLFKDNHAVATPSKDHLAEITAEKETLNTEVRKED